MSISPDTDDRIRFAPGHEQDREGLETTPCDDLQPDYEVGGDTFIESFLE